ncbi:c-type cytochrome biogenesis protein CcmI [Nitrosovibrio sp. Nv17]|uniref:c-type cytochrome biogenesis protein CcmI n=1 Tax=Nitrosovibrio sp. Nv17 TaxID=1855339 RepID=UPI00090895D1|nr:c-type cytochrome biogenesis protein CcmI [Nitrosovibrio sp. Nv17]SFW15753.1 cytochrome c-type biogenesis protein CcmH [Nitrosovibrio sp. Nv17]
MTTFWVVAGVFIVGALLFVLPTLLKRKNPSLNTERDATNINIYRDQLAELESDLRSDILTREQYESSKQELQQRMLEDIPEAGAAGAMLAPGNRGNVATTAVIVLAIPILAISLYLWVGDTRGLVPQVPAEHMPLADDGGHPNFSSVLDNLTARLAEHPEDAEGWTMLARTYGIMQRFHEAKEAYEKALALSPEDAGLITDYADVVAMTNNGSLVGQPRELIDRALRLDPRNPKALALAGTAEFEQEKFGRAADYWEQLLALVPPDSELAQSVKNSIAEARSLAAGKGSIMAQAPAASPPASSGGAGAAAPGPGGGTLSGSVTLAPAMAGKASPNDSLYIFARAKSGPKAPLATLRLQVKDLPASFTLNDSMARSGVQLSTFSEEMVVGARISKSGSPMPQSGDLQGLSRPIRIGASGISVVIDQALP